MNKNILITGAGGFVGRNLYEFLKDRYNVYGATHKELDVLEQDDVREYINNKKIDVVIHCANVGGSRKSDIDGNSNVVSDNLRMFFNLVSSLKPEMHMIHFGSGAEYGKNRDLNKVSVKEFGEHIPKDDYGFSKYVASRYIEKADNITCLRIFGLYGKYEDYSFKFISNAILKSILGLPIVINQNVVFDYLYIDDCLNIIDSFITKMPKSKFINLTPSNSIDLFTIANIINKISLNINGKQSKIILINENLNYEYTGDNNELLNELNNYRFTSYEEGIARLYKYYLENIKSIDKNIVMEDPYLKSCNIKTMEVSNGIRK